MNTNRKFTRKAIGVVIHSRLEICHKYEIPILEWVECGAARRRELVRQGEAVFSQFVNQEYARELRRVAQAVEETNAARAQCADSFQMAFCKGVVHGLKEFIGRIGGLANLRTFKCKNVRTRNRTDGVSYSHIPGFKSRAPYSYEFEDSPLPAPPVEADPYWQGGGR